MADPAIVACPAGAWTLVAEEVVTGIIHKKITDVHYFQTYRMTGEAAPTDLTDAVNAFIGGAPEVISASAAIDVYLWANEKDGSVRVDL